MLFERDGPFKMTKCSVKKQVKVKKKEPGCDYDSQGQTQSSEDATTSQKSPETVCLRPIK